MTQEKFLNKSIFIFDAFGTLFKTSEVDEALNKIAQEQTESLITVWRKKQLEYSWLRNQMNQYVPFSQVTKEALTYSMRFHGLENKRIYELLLPIYDSPNLVAGAFEFLQFLKKSKTSSNPVEENKIGILSNGTQAMLENGIAKTGIGNLIDFVFSVDEIQIYKPRKEVYQMVDKHSDISPNQLLFFSSNQWDISGASSYGWDSVWVNQYEEVREELPFGEVNEIKKFSDLQF